MRNWILICLCLCLTMGIASTGCNKEKIAVATFEGVGQVLIEFKSEVEAKHISGEISTELYVKSKLAYNTARGFIFLAGDTLISAIQEEDAINRQVLISESLWDLNEAKNLILEILNLLDSNGIKLEKASNLSEKLKS